MHSCKLEHIRLYYTKEDVSYTEAIKSYNVKQV